MDRLTVIILAKELFESTKLNYVYEMLEVFQGFQGVFLAVASFDSP